MPSQLPMEIRSMNVDDRALVGVVAPYDETSYLVPDPRGERIRRGAFRKSLQERASKILLFRNHDHSRSMGRSKSFEDTDDGLVGTFSIHAGTAGDDFIEEVRNGYLSGLSVGFLVLDREVHRDGDGAREIREAKLLEVSAVGMPAYESAGMLARDATNPTDWLAPFLNRPDVNLSPIARPW